MEVLLYLLEEVLLELEEREHLLEESEMHSAELEFPLEGLELLEDQHYLQVELLMGLEAQEVLSEGLETRSEGDPKQPEGKDKSAGLVVLLEVLAPELEE